MKESAQTIMGGDGVAFAAIMPHAPILVPGVGRARQHGQAGATIAAMTQVARRLVAVLPDVVVVVSPHSPQRRGAFGIWSTPLLHASFAQFGARETAFGIPLDLEFAERVGAEARSRRLVTWRITRGELDHGAAVPLVYLVEAGWQSPTVVLGLPPGAPPSLEAFGQAISATAAALHRRVAIVASGDMSHRANGESAAATTQPGLSFDREFIDVLRHGATRVATLDGNLIEAAGQDVFESTLVATAAADPSQLHSSVLAYENPFGVGYGVAVLSESSSPLADLAIKHASAWLLAHPADLPFVARDAVVARFADRPVSCPHRAGGRLLEPHGLYVTLRTRAGVLRGCWGSPTPSHANLVEATWHLARFAAFHDPRFRPLQSEEIREVRFSVSVLDGFESIRSIAELEPSLYGLLIRAADGRRSLMLPAIKGIEFADEQLRAAKRKASIAPAESVEMQRFVAATFCEPQRFDEPE